MRHPIRWHNAEKTILYIRAEPNWTWDEAYEVMNRIYEFEDAVTHGVHMIFDFTDTSFVPRGSMSNFKKLMGKPHPNDRLVIFINSNRMIQFMVETIQKLYQISASPLTYHFVRNMDEALKRIAAYKE